ncbi:MAG: DUF962 domain-containing protein [Polyangiaceae bacterium]|nr:DUF962 domain-containing protein [Polyangiaceae bacterium]
MEDSEGREFDSFEDFWEYYVLEHSKKITRQLHFAGATAALACAATAILTPHKWTAFLIPVVGYLPAWIGHFVYEENVPATFGNPIFSARAGMKMYRMMVEGTMDAEVERVVDDAMAAPMPPDIRPNMMTDRTLH